MPSYRFGFAYNAASVHLNMKKTSVKTVCTLVLLEVWVTVLNGVILASQLLFVFHKIDIIVHCISTILLIFIKLVKNRFCGLYTWGLGLKLER